MYLCYSEVTTQKQWHIVQYNPLPSTISFGATTFIYHKTRRCPTAIISDIDINLFLEHDYGSRYTFSTEQKGVCTLQNVSFSLRKNVTIFQTVLHRTRWPCCSVAEQHANTQSFICKADGSATWYPSTLVMVWVPGFLIHGSRAKMESMNSIYCIFLLFFIPK